MQVLNTWLQRQIAVGLVVLLAAPIGAAETISNSPPQPVAYAVPVASRSQPENTSSDPAVLESSPALASAAPLPSLPESPGAMLVQAPAQNQQAAAPQSTQNSQPNAAQAPLGTAASPYEKPGGAPASRPAGAAIAPAKQRRIHTFSIRVALIVGAAVAIGVVTAASLSSPNRAN